MQKRRYLALQGTASPFFARIQQQLVLVQASCRRVNFCGGDWLYADRTAEASDYAGTQAELADWYQNELVRTSPTDILMFGDCRVVHQPVHAVAASLGMRVHVFEEGYVRPHWLTMERHGVNGRSLLPKDPAWYLEHRKYTPPAPPAFSTGYNLYVRAYHDIRYRIANERMKAQFPHYQSHRPYDGLTEYKGLIKRKLFLQRGFDRDSDNVVAELAGGRRPYYVFPLQLNSDSQVVVHSPFSGIREAIEQVMRSFVAHAPSDALLVIKNHPLDTGLDDYHAYASQLANELGMLDRLRYIEAGHLPTLLDHSRGVVVINSTVGLSAIHHRRPLMALGKAIYKMPGLTWHGSLDDFWLGGEPPDMGLYYAFLDYVVHHTQINGDFYSKTGIEMAIPAIIKRLEADDA